MRNQTLSVVVPSRNEGRRLRQTVSEIVDGDLGTGITLREVIIVDDQSSDGSAEGEFPSIVKVVRPDKRLGVARAKNFGATFVTGDFVVWSDAHIGVPPGWAAQLIDELKAEDVGAVSPGIQGMEADSRIGYGGTWATGDPSLNWRWLSKAGTAAYEVPLLPGGFMAMRRDVLERTQGFDGKLGTWGEEDVEISLRLWAMGLKCLAIPDVAVRHAFKSDAGVTSDGGMLIYNKLRVAALHLPDERFTAFVQRIRRIREFPDAMTRFIRSDTLHRREELERTRVRPREWIIDRFSLGPVFDDSPA
ncbi:glycosyltransferase [Streptomyces sp. NPDC058297]|uniref:glycosyltransferase n=1 Tax=Streptomyces sp. NPDC058297 TaxID=3346433 RepID=UPI0036E906C9